ncbi:hypothetical protein DPMN_128686 [Dreissena polymorpha]|uniref:Uncharacterized protein n=1 Tax=Dreissena polymorpha TaxID=45954 RepID=A0A9D4JVZ7_DREPO|nr:hypothetical protein DPMN_128686 [Dreissena polymorpha]
MRQKQQKAVQIRPILEAKLAGVKPKQDKMLNKSPETRHYWIIWDTLENTLWYVVSKVSENRYR